MRIPLRLTLPSLTLAATAACPVPSSAPGPAAGTPEAIAVRVNEGTALAFDLSPDGRWIVFDLLGQLWLLPAEGGEARPITDAVRDTAEDLDPTFSPDGRRVAFHGERNGRTGLWLLDLDSAVPRQLTQLANPDGDERGAAWSPDGRIIAFARTLPPAAAGDRWRSNVVLLDVASGVARDLQVEGASFAEARDPAWTPDGSRIAFVACSTRGAPGGRVLMVEAIGGVAWPVTPASVEAGAPAFSPDGRRLAYFATDSAHRVQVWVQEVVGSDGDVGAPLRLTSHRDVTPTRIRWSSDGRSIIYSADGRLWRAESGGRGGAEIPFTAELSFRRPRRALAPVRFPEPGERRAARGFMGLALSPDGRRIGMLALGKLWVIPVGGTPQAVAPVPLDASQLAWSPGGGELAWSAGGLEQEDLFATEVATGVTRRVTALPGRELYPAYSPDGRHLAFVHQQETAQLRVVDSRATAVADTAATRNLGPIGRDGTSPPQWSPESDALVIPGGTSLRTRGRATLVSLSGQREPMARFPEAPVFLQWPADSTVVFARHDRMWRARLDRTGLVADPQPLGDAPALYASAARDGTILFVSEGGLRLRSPDGAERRLGWPLSYTTPAAEPLVIRNVRIIDGTGAPATPPRDLLIQEGRIARIAATGTVPSDAGRVLDAQGRFAIPGLMDLHAHTYWPPFLPGFLHFGVTTVRDQGSSMGPLVAYADAIAAGLLPGPRVGFGGFQYYSDWAFDEDQGRGVEPEADSDHVRRAVALAEIFGAQHIKTRTFRRWDINARLVLEAHRRGLRATGHCAHQLPLVAAGIDAKEHAGLCAPRGDMYLYADLIQLFRAAGIGVVPTVTYFGFAARLSQRPALLEDDVELAPFLPDREQFGWMLGLGADKREELFRTAERARETTAALWRAGVTIGTGSDIWQVPTRVHMELEELVAAGLPPVEAIRAGTGSAARILGADPDLGTIEAGKWADLVILDADPLADIRNTRRIWQVVQGGRVVDRPGIRQRVGLR